MDVSRIDREIATGEFFTNEVPRQSDGRRELRGKQLHLIGLISTVSAFIARTSLRAVRMANKRGVERVLYIAFSMGAIRRRHQPLTM